MDFFNKRNLKAKLHKPVLALQTIQIIRYTTLILISIAFVKSKLSTENIGIYEKFIFFASAISFFWLNALIQNIIATFNKHHSKEQKIFLFNSFIIIVLVSLIIVFFFVLFQKPLAILYINYEKVPYTSFFCLYLTLSPVGSLVEYIYLIQNKIKSIYTYALLSYLFQLIIITIPVFFSDNLLYPIVGLIITSLVRFIWATVLVLRFSIFKISYYHIKNILFCSSPLALSFFIAGYINYIDGIFISQFFDNETFAIFRYGAREIPLSTILLASLSNAMVPVISRAYNIYTVTKSIKYYLIKYMNVLFPLSIFLAIVSPILFKYIYNNAFIKSAFIFNILLCLLIPRILLPQTFLLARQKNNEILLASFAELLAKIFLNFILIKTFNIYGLAISTVLAAFIEKTVLFYYTNKYLKIMITDILDTKKYFVYSFLLILSVIISFIIYK